MCFAYRLLNVKVASSILFVHTKSVTPPPPAHSDVLILQGKDPVFSVRFLSGNIGFCEDPGTRQLMTEGDFRARLKEKKKDKKGEMRTGWHRLKEKWKLRIELDLKN